MMSDAILMGDGREIQEVPTDDWLRPLAEVPAHMQRRLAFMTPAHHQVRNFVVRYLPANAGKPLPPDHIADRLGMTPAHVESLLGDLEQNLFFLVRNEAGEVSWAFPVTVEVTPHRLKFASGERLYAA